MLLPADHPVRVFGDWGAPFGAPFGMPFGIIFLGLDILSGGILYDYQRAVF